MQRNTFSLLVTCLCLALLAGVRAIAVSQQPGSTGDALPKVQMTMGFFNNLQTETGLGQADQYFAQQVDVLSRGRITIDLHPSGSLCAETKCIQDVLQGSLDIGVSSDSNYGSITSAFFILGMPYLWKGPESQNRILNDWLGEQMDSAVAKNNLKVLFYLENDGFRNLWHNESDDIHVPSDARNIKLRTTNSPVELAIDRAYEFQPVTVDSREMFSALGQKVVRGMLNNDEWMVDGRYYEVVPSVSVIGVQIGYEPVTMRLDKFNSLPSAVKKLLLEAGRRTQLMQERNMVSVATQGYKALEAHGVKVYKPTSAELTQWTKIAPTVWAEFTDQAPPSLIQRILKLQGCPSTGCAPAIH